MAGGVHLILEAAPHLVLPCVALLAWRRVPRPRCRHARALSTPDRCAAAPQWRPLAALALTRAARPPAQARAFGGGDKAGGVLSEFAKSVKSGLEGCAAKQLRGALASRVPAAAQPGRIRSPCRAQATPLRRCIRRSSI
jgi:hypothetical protein